MANSTRRILNAAELTGSYAARNYISNPNSQTNTAGWATYADAAATTPVDGTGGSPTVTYTRTTSSPIAGDGSFLFTKDAANRQGEGASFDFTIDRADRNKVLAIRFDYEIASGTFTTSSSASDIQVFIYDVTNSTLITPGNQFLVSGSSGTSERYISGFIDSTSSTSYRLILHTATTSASAYTVKFDNFYVGPAENTTIDFINMTDWVSFTTTITGSTSNPTKGTIATDTGRWRRVGDTMEIEYEYRQTAAGSAGSGAYLLSIPSGYTIDTTKTGTATTTNLVTCGKGVIGNVADLAGSSARECNVVPYNTTNLSLWGLVDGSSNFSQFGSASFALSTTVVAFTFKAAIPITNWTAMTNGSVIYNSGNMTNNQSTANTGNGFGATNTLIRRFSNQTTTGNTSNIVYADSSTLGATWTIGQNGIYMITYTDGTTTTANQTGWGISRNGTVGTSVLSLNDYDPATTTSQRLAGGQPPGTGTMSWMGTLLKNDVIRAHSTGGGMDTSFAAAQFTIVQIGLPGLVGVPKTQTAYVSDVKTAGTAGGTFTSGSFQTRTLQTLTGDTSFITLSSNQITLQPGTYQIYAIAPAFEVDRHQAKLRDITNSSDAIIGSSSYSSASGQGDMASTIMGTITISATTTYEVQHRCGATEATNGFGIESNFGISEVYTKIRIDRINP